VAGLLLVHGYADHQLSDRVCLQSGCTAAVCVRACANMRCCCELMCCYLCCSWGQCKPAPGQMACTCTRHTCCYVACIQYRYLRALGVGAVHNVVTDSDACGRVLPTLRVECRH
jgi:hypothetical protein